MKPSTRGLCLLALIVLASFTQSSRAGLTYTATFINISDTDDASDRRNNNIGYGAQVGSSTVFGSPDDVGTQGEATSFFRFETISGDLTSGQMNFASLTASMVRTSSYEPGTSTGDFLIEVTISENGTALGTLDIVTEGFGTFGPPNQGNGQVNVAQFGNRYAFRGTDPDDPYDVANRTRQIAYSGGTLSFTLPGTYGVTRGAPPGSGDEPYTVSGNLYLVTTVPEPSTVALLGIGGSALLAMRLRRQRKR